MARDTGRLIILLCVLVAFVVWLEPATRAVASATDPVIAVSSDVQIASGLSMTVATATYNTARAMQPDQAWLAGDEANDASTAEYNTYGTHWGKFGTKLHVVPGNHDEANLTNYSKYFGSRGNPLPRAETIGSWRVEFIDSQKSIAAGSAQYNFVRNDLAAHPHQPIAAIWHIPRWSTDCTHANSTKPSALWTLLYQFHADLVIDGHAHNYQRWTQLNPSGTSSPNGIREFVVGTGGAPLRSFCRTDSRVQYQENTQHGVLKLILHPTSYEWQFVSTAGKVMDRSSSPVPTHNRAGRWYAVIVTGALTFIPSDHASIRRANPTHANPRRVVCRPLDASDLEGATGEHPR